jgi:hypothetical protein
MVNLRDYVQETARNSVKDNVHSWIFSKREEISLDNSALFKAKDIEFLDEVRDYLGDDCSLKGSVERSAKNGNPREYNDIDLLTTSPGIDAENIVRLLKASKGLEKINDWEVTSLTTQDLLYVGTRVDYRFKIRSPKTKTVIDLNFGSSYGLDTLIKSVEDSGFSISKDAFGDRSPFVR